MFIIQSLSNYYINISSSMILEFALVITHDIIDANLSKLLVDIDLLYLTRLLAINIVNSNMLFVGIF